MLNHSFCGEAFLMKQVRTFMGWALIVAALFCSKIFRIVAPACYQLSHVGRELAVEVHFLLGDGVNEAQCFGMQCLARTHLKAVVNELRIVARGVASEHFVAAIALVVEERMPDMLHVHT